MEKYRALPTSKTLNAVNDLITVRGKIKQLIEQLVLNIIHLHIIQECRKLDKLFNETYRQVVMCGSWRDNLKINAPDEIDVNIVFDMKPTDFQSVANGCVNVHWSDPAQMDEQLRNYIDSNGNLRINKFQSWFEGRLSKLHIHNSTIIIREHTVHITVHKNGPAHMLRITVKSSPTLPADFKLSVDISPAIMGTSENWPFEDKQPLKFDNGTWLVVAKPLNGVGNTENVSFVRSFPNQEHELLKERATMKSVIRLIKKIAQNKSMGNLKSYFIKTACLWTKQDTKLWNCPLDVAVEKILEKLLGFYENRYLPNYWTPERNELRKFEQNQIDTLRMQLESILKQYRKYKNNVELFDLFVTPDEKEQMYANIVQKQKSLKRKAT